MIFALLPPLLAWSLAPAAPAEERIAAWVSRDAALANVRELVSLGPRMGGTSSGDRSAAAIASKLRELGLSVEVTQDPPLLTHEETSWTVKVGDRALASAWPYGFSPSLRPITARLELESTEGTVGGDLKGSVILTDRGLRDVYEAAVKARAIALLTDAPADPNRFLDWARLGSLEGVGEESRPLPVFGLSYRDGRLLREALAAAPRDTWVTLALVSSIRKGRPRTVIGTLPGSGLRKKEILIVCAHGDSDSGGPGADDNASGMASLVEVARALTGARAGGLLPANRPTVRLIVWGSEYHSSGAYVTSRPREMARLKGVFNYDETGFGSERDAVYFEGNDIPWNATLLRTLEAVADDHSGPGGFLTAYTSVPALGGTDAYAFLPCIHRGMGLTKLRIPATTVFTAAWDRPTRVPQRPGWKSKGWREPGDLFVDYSAYYHSSGDTPANTTEAEPFNMERCARLVALAIYRIMEEESPQSAEAERARGSHTSQQVSLPTRCSGSRPCGSAP